MDIFQLLGDFLHLIAILILLLKILANKNVIGISYKTQQIYMIVFLTRYSDMFLNSYWGSFYFNFMRLFFLFITGYTIYTMKKRPFRLSYDAQLDGFAHYYLYLLALVLAMLFHRTFTVYGIFWAYSIWLQSLAILPQLHMISHYKQIENITAYVVLFLGCYRFMYVLHWIYNWDNLVLTSFCAGILQSILYTDFIIYFFKSKENQRIIINPI